MMQEEGGRIMTPQEEQIKWLQDTSNSVKRNAFYMKRALVRCIGIFRLEMVAEKPDKGFASKF